MTTASRGQVFHADIGRRGPHFYVVVSNNARNRALKSVLALMITTTDKSHIPTAVQLTHQDPFTGWVVADNIDTLWDDELPSISSGALSPPTMAKVNDAIKVAFGLT
ncbi:type II toxin-antitoxin system PemK/MazF family toxin [Mycobacterium sp. TY815]|uniref:type II toxin-antitoxin system PemK/MazF family toxin n=1 Tax=Mycobacterium sp. TY815 TaxID=3050581 RepID=UPI0027424BDE|nr:type II toxin-antitoxin system PemK/MazF family toxin [Mycobacterium sp. TY815]MDP7703244.1 type II toxin-antitoxin system PemK/MazF family toxin [Mycobacterium sp. TY815]